MLSLRRQIRTFRCKTPTCTLILHLNENTYPIEYRILFTYIRR
jgi:hypothetical protein